MTGVLVVDNDTTVRDVVTSYLKAEGYSVDEAEDGEAALAKIRRERPDLIVLDVILPGVDGLVVCRRVRAASQTPVIMLTALGSHQDRVAGLEVGADDYLAKPFSPRELMLRVSSVLRRARGTTTPDPSVLRDGELLLNGSSRTASISGRPVTLTVREFNLLRFLVSRPDVAFTRVDLLERVWGWSFGDQSTVTVHVRRLREKIEDHPSTPTRLVTHRGVGYRWASTRSEASSP